MRMHLLMAFGFATLFATPALADEVPCDGVTTNNGHANLTIFINGILNGQGDACASLSALRNTVDIAAEKSDFRLFYNDTQGALQDTAELRLQAQISDRAHDIAQNDYTIRINGATARYNYVLGKLYSDKLASDVYQNDTEREVYIRTFRLYNYLKEQTQNGKHITVVAHSQGNLYIEAAIAIMRYRGEDDTVAKIRVVGVAPVSSSTPNGVYFSLQGDRAIGLQRAQTSALRFYSPLPANAAGCMNNGQQRSCGEAMLTSANDWFMHSFVRIYMNPFVMVNGVSLQDRIRDQVVLAQGAPVPPASKNQQSAPPDCDAYFWIASAQHLRTGEYRIRFETARASGPHLSVSYRFSISRNPREHNPRHGTSAWWPSYTTNLTGGVYTVTVTKDRQGNDRDTSYRRTIVVGENLTPDQSQTCPQ